jgi:hypothetical protein
VHSYVVFEKVLRKKLKTETSNQNLSPICLSSNIKTMNFYAKTGDMSLSKANNYTLKDLNDNEEKEISNNEFKKNYKNDQLN